MEKRPQKLYDGIHRQLNSSLHGIKRLAIFKFNVSSVYEFRLRRMSILSLYAVFVGIVAGFGAVGFRYLIAFFHNLFFSGIISFSQADAKHDITYWWVIFIPMLGMLVVHFLTQNFAPEAKGHGVPEVMAAILKRGGKIRSVVAVVKAIASAICIGSGGSVGREGPIVQIGASFGSTLGQLFRLKPQETISLVCAGVAGGIAATFNAPIGGVAFALELMLPEFSILRLMPLVVSATIATYIGSVFLGTEPAFIIPQYSLVSPYEFIFYIILGFAAGGVAIIYIKTLYGMERLVDNIKCNSYIKASIGGLLLGICGYILYRTIGHYYIFGVGYSFITDALNAHSWTLPVILLLLFAKIFANSLTLSSGGSGGVFAPSLFIGIATGSLIGIIVNHLFPNITAPVSAYALVGMAAVVSGTTGAALTSIIMTFEMTRNYEIMLPLMLSVVIASFVTRFFYHETIYTKKFSQNGSSIHLDKLINIFRLTPVRELVNHNIVFVKPEMSIEDALSILVFHNFTYIPVIDNEKCLGTVTFRDIYGIEGSQKIKDYIIRQDLDIDISADSVEALKRMDSNQLGLLIVYDQERIAGYITRQDILKKYFEKRELLLG